MFCGMTYYDVLWFFCIYSFLGWVVEVAYHALSQGKVVNRGFLNGPVCPIYGAGVVGIFALSNLAVRDVGASSLSVPVVFLSGMALATLLELVTGWLLETVFHARWWDYSREPFNFRGYICAKFSILWGLATVFVVRIIHPLVQVRTPVLFPRSLGWILLSVIYGVWLLDLIVTVRAVHGLSKDLAELDAFQKGLRGISDRMTTEIAGRSFEAQRKLGAARVQASLAQMELKDAALAEHAEWEARRAGFEAQKARFQAQLSERAERLRNSRIFGRGRILDAFPDLQSHRYKEALEALREALGKQ